MYIFLENTERYSFDTGSQQGTQKSHHGPRAFNGPCDPCWSYLALIHKPKHNLDSSGTLDGAVKALKVRKWGMFEQLSQISQKYLKINSGKNRESSSKIPHFLTLSPFTAPTRAPMASTLYVG